VRCLQRRRNRRRLRNVQEKFGKLDILVHAIAYAPAEELRGQFIDTTREGFRIATTSASTH